MDISATDISFVRSFVRSFVLSFVRLVIWSFVRSLGCMQFYDDITHTFHATYHVWGTTRISSGSSFVSSLHQ